MMNRVRFFSRAERMDPKRDRRKPRLERRNAVKNFDYDAASSSSSIDDSASTSSSLVTRSLDIPDRTSFRIEGDDGEFDRICRSLGLKGPDDFAIPEAAWEAMKLRSASDLLPRSRFNQLFSPRPEDLGKEKENEEREEVASGVDELCNRVSAATELTRCDSAESSGEPCGGGGVRLLESVRIRQNYELTRSESTESGEGCSRSTTNLTPPPGGGIKGARPPLLKPPPAMTLPVIDNTCSTWDILRDFAPDTAQCSHQGRGFCPSDDHDDEQDKTEEVEEKNANEAVNKREAEEEEEEEEERVLRIGETGVLSESCSFTTSNDDDSSSTTTEPPSNNSPAGIVRFRRVITDWQKGDLLGRGSFGSVYEGISDNGFFFAVKEVSLLDQGSQGRQSIYQLEQEIALLSQFEHENIVQYYGTQRDESKLYIFLEFVTKGSLLNLYQKYHLRESQVSAYTRQILRGLKYLHDQNVVHRDIKCANILVHATGSVKLADFGLAKATKLNDVKSCKGTAFWMAPEVVNRKGQGYGLPADVWSLGCTVLEMLTQQIPYSHLECMQALFRIGKGEPPPVPDSLSENARDFILQCIKVNPSDRPAACQLLDHPFVRSPLPTSSGSASPYIGSRS